MQIIPLSEKLHQSLSIITIKIKSRLKNYNWLQDTFNLTPKEFEIAEHLIVGDSLPDTAKLLGVSHNTVRTHVANLLSKTHTKSQLEFVSLVHNISDF